MSADLSSESTGGAGKIAVSENAKRQIGAQVAEGKTRSADAKLRSSNFLEAFQEFPEFAEG